MEKDTKGSLERSRASVKRLEGMLESVREIQNREGVSPDLLKGFQERYHELPREERPWFFENLLQRLEIQRSTIEGDLKALQTIGEGDWVRWGQHVSALRRHLESPRLRAFRRFLNLSGGLKFLLDLRADVLAAQRQTSVNLGPLDEEIAHLFDSWFQSGFLFLHEITQDSPYRQIRFLMDHDMVHPMSSLEEMGNRLGEDRRCFALYHKAMPEEPVVFIEVALTRGIAKSIHDIIRGPAENARPKGTPDTAIFYSINNTQNGLAGLGLGKILIFQVVDALKKDHPEIKIFSTLSPIPGFWDRYFKRILQGDDAPFAMRRDRLIKEMFPGKIQEAILQRHGELSAGEAKEFSPALLEILSQPNWIEDPAYAEWLRKPLSEVTYFYVAQEKDKQGRPLNPVANFHIENGATVSARNINYAANRSRRGLEESCGMMVNYVYSQTWLQQIGRTMKGLIPWKVQKKP